MLRLAAADPIVQAHVRYRLGVCHWKLGAIDDTHLVAVGTSIVLSDDAGRTWRTAPVRAPDGGSFVDVSVRDGVIVAVTTSRVVVSTDGGDTWLTRPFAG